MNPAPPQTLNKETIRVWHGWNNIGDKEVAREAAAKGLHVNLAVTFLSLRKNVRFEDAQIWFKEEILKWVRELLDRNQIFKASHLLNNIEIDAGVEFSKIFFTTTSTNLRECIGKHLLKVGQLDENSQQLWSFLNIILEQSHTLQKHKLAAESLECLNELSDPVKSEMAVELLLKTEDIRLTRFINGETLWAYLLVNNNLKHLLTWINVRYNSNEDDVPRGNVVEQFKKFHITSQMIDLVSNEEFSVSEDVRNAIYNELSRFGIFRNEEKHNFILILGRLKNSFSMANLYQVFERDQSTVNLDDFLKLLTDYCSEEQLLNVLNVCLKNFRILPSRIQNEYISLIDEFRFLAKDFSDAVLCKSIFNVARMLSTDTVDYLSDNPVTFLTLLFFTRDSNFVNIIKTDEPLIINDSKLNDSLQSMLKSFNIFAVTILRKTNRLPEHTVDLYNLVDRHLGTDSKLLFEFRFLNKELSQFYITEMVDAYGYSKVLNYKFYLKESRPSIAAKFFALSKLSSKKTEKKICRIAITSFDIAEISSSCSVLLELLGVDSTKMRVLTSIAKILDKSGFEKTSLVELLLRSDDEPYDVQNTLENLLMEMIDTQLLTNSNLIKVFRIYETIIVYSKLNNIKLPEQFLRSCASRNLWLPFFLLAQIHEYPLDQIKMLIQFFKSPNMLEHLIHGVVNDIQVEEKNVLIRERDSRKYFLSKVGVRKTLDAVSQTSSQSIRSQSSLESGGSSTSSDLFEIDVYNIKATLLQTLIKCHNSTDPPKALLQACQLYRNPLLAILATSYEPDSLVTNWLTWLAVSCGMCKVFTNYETTAMSANSVTNLLENCLRSRFPKTILESFEIFMPENPLKVFMEFINCCCQLNFNNMTMISKLNAFKAFMKNARKNSILSETDHEMTYLNSKLWIEITAVKLLAALIEYNCTSLYEQILIVKSLCKLEIWTYLSCEHSKFTNLLSILEILYYSNTGVCLETNIYFDLKDSRQSVISCINQLLDKQQYQIALQIAQIENLPPDLILVKEWQNKMNDRTDQNFWNLCNETFTKQNVTADCIVDFYLDCSEKLSDLVEKFTLLKLAWEWATKYDLTSQYELEKKMWLAFLCLEEKHKNLNVFDFKVSKHLYMDILEMLNNIVPFEGELSKDFTNQLERIVAFILNKNNFWAALKIQKIFNCKSADLETLKLCHSLAEGILLPHQLNAEQRLLLSNVSYLRTYSNRRTFLSTKISGFSTSSYSPGTSIQNQTTDSLDSYMNDTLTIIKLLSDHLHNGLEIGQNIFMHYRISINIEIPYQVIVMTTDYLRILKDALDDNCMNKIDVVHDFILAYKWSKLEIADFICEELVNVITSYTDFHLDQLLMWDLNLDQDFQLILQLLQDSCSLLGYKIYTYANTLHKSQIESMQLFKASDLSLVIELLIRAHDCFTADCNMEGISVILKKSREVVANLLILQDWKLMVRLLTGVARYTEMNYVFQILRENDQFEFLLRKGFRKDNTLKVALLEYLKKYCPDNRDLYKIVALHFALFSEVALLWEREAQNIIKNLISISVLEMQNNKCVIEEEPFVLLQNTQSTKVCLNKAMENYIHATEFHLQGEKLTMATNSANQAELIALQLAFLHDVSANTSTTCLLNLKKSQISELISSKLSFEQSLILVEAYSFYVDWASVLYEQYVVRNNVVFLEDFLKHLPLTETLAMDVSRKFIVANINSVNEIKCMKNLLNKVTSLQMKYRIASELGFIDLVEDLIASGQLVYLKDTVWKKGYKN